MSEIKLPPLPGMSTGALKNAFEEYARAAIELALQQRGEPVAWQPIDTAPTDSDAHASVLSDETIFALAVEKDISSINPKIDLLMFTLDELLEAGHAIARAAIGVTPQPAAPVVKDSLTVAESVKEVSDLDALGEQCNRLQDALAFYMPDVPDADHPLHARIAHDAFLLCGYDGSDSVEPSAHELGLISLAAPVKVPSDEALLNLLSECGAMATINGVNAIRLALSRYGQSAQAVEPVKVPSDGDIRTIGVRHFAPTAGELTAAQFRTVKAFTIDVLSRQPAQPAAPDWPTINTAIAKRFPDDPANAVRAQAAITEVLAAQPAASAEPIELQGISETLENGDGFWRSCTGCHELNEGHDTGPYSQTLKCHLGCGCSECGGIGAIWDTTDYQAMADAMATPVAAQPRVPDSWHEAVQVAYGHLWMVNNEPGTPNQYTPEKAAYEARKLLRSLLTKEDRGDGINAAMLAAAPTPPADGQAQQDDRSDWCRLKGCSHKAAGSPVWEMQQDADRVDAAFEAVRQQLCRLTRFNFYLGGGCVRREPDKSGNWVDFTEVHALFDPVSVDAARAQQEGK